jgi:hypothetical protein
MAKIENKDEMKTVAEAPATPVAVSAPKKFKVTVDGAEYVYAARDKAEAWAYHNDYKKTQYSVKQKSPVIEEVK